MPCWTQGREATQRQDLDRVAELNSALHLRVIEVSGNPWLSRSPSLYHHVQWVFRLGAAERAPHSWEEHIRLVDAIEQATATGRAAALDHLERRRAAHVKAEAGYGQAD